MTLTPGQEAAARRDRGMERAEDHANRETPKWSERAYAALENHCKTHPLAEFSGENIRIHLERTGAINEPPDGRAWGGIFQRAARNKLIEKTGRYELAASSNLSPKPIWRVV